MTSAVRNRRADANRSRAAILDAALCVFEAQPDASLETIATAAGVTRQTVYAHFNSRQQLLLVIVDRITDEVVAAMDAAELHAGPAADTLLRLLEASERTASRYPVLLQKISTLPVSPQTEHHQHAPVADRIRRVIQRGQEIGEFDERLPPDWLVAVTVKLAHTASVEQHAGRMTREQAKQALRTSVLRVLGAATGEDRAPRRWRAGRPSRPRP